MPIAMETRTASSPLAGGVRVGIGVTLAQIASYFAAQFVPATIAPQVDELLIIGIASALAVVGKMLRDRGVSLTPV